MSNTVVMRDGDFAIVHSEALFCSGYNVYKSSTPDGDEFLKINDRLGWFETLDAATSWMQTAKGGK